jgi:hypothetical protein
VDSSNAPVAFPIPVDPPVIKTTCIVYVKKG